MTDRLKPCPFCGGDAKLEINREMGGTQYQVLCTNCPTTVGRHWFWKKEDAIKAWNTRKPMDRIVEALEEEIEYCEKQADKISATSFSIVNGLKRNIYIEKISAYRDAIIIVEEGGREYE